MGNVGASHRCYRHHSQSLDCPGRVVVVFVGVVACIYCSAVREVVVAAVAGGCNLVTRWRAQLHCSNPVVVALGTVMAAEAAPHSRSASVGLSIRRYRVAAVVAGRTCSRGIVEVLREKLLESPHSCNQRLQLGSQSTTMGVCPIWMNGARPCCLAAVVADDIAQGVAADIAAGYTVDVGTEVADIGVVDTEVVDTGAVDILVADTGPAGIGVADTAAAAVGTAAEIRHVVGQQSLQREPGKRIILPSLPLSDWTNTKQCKSLILWAMDDGARHY